VSSLPARTRGWHPVAKGAFWLGVAVAVLIAAFDWNWFRPSVERYFSEKSHRSVRIDDFHVAWSWGLDPTFRLRGVKVENAPWADPRPFLVAAEFVATCELSSLLRKRPVIRHLRLVDADVDLERQADGLRNWRLTRPDDRGPGVVRVLALEAVRSKIRFVHRGLDLDVQTAAAPAEADMAPLTTRVTFDGTFRGAPFSGEALTGPELTFLETGRSFPIRGHALASGARLDVDGRATDVFTLAAVDAAVALKAPSLALFGPFLARDLPRTPAIAVNGRLHKVGEVLSLETGSASIGATQLSGTVALERTAAASRLRADLRSRAIRLEDLRWTREVARALNVPAHDRLQAAPPPSTRTREGLKGMAASSAPQSADTAPEHRFAADLHLSVDRLSAGSWPAASNLDLTATLADGVLAIAPLRFAVGRGHATARLELDTRREPPEARLRADLHDVHLESLLPALPADKRISGALNAAVDLVARGHTLDQWLASVAGDLSARLHGGSMSRKLDAELGLSGSRFLRALFGASEQVPIRCAATDIALRAGHAHLRRMRLETERTRIDGSGSADLKSGAFDMLLTPSPERPGLLELRKSIEVKRVAGKVSYALADPKPDPRARSCLEQSP